MKKKRIKKEDISKERLEYFLKKCYPNIQIAKEMDCSVDFIGTCIKYYGLQKPSVSDINKKMYDSGRKVNCKIYDVPLKEDIEYLYHEKKMSMNKIKDIFDTSIPTLKKWMKEFNINQRSRSESQKLTVNKERTSMSQIGKEAHECINNKQWLQDAYNEMSSEHIAKLLNISSTIILQKLHSFDIYIQNKYCVSFYENEIKEFIESVTDLKVIQGDRTILNGKELDIYIPEKKLAIEFNGIFWHSEQQGKDKKYHLKKTEMCEAKGIQLLHIFENEWVDGDKQLIWKSVIKNKLGFADKKIGARKCKIIELRNCDTSPFLIDNHLQGTCPSSVKYGLHYDDELVSVMTFSVSRFNKNYRWELARFCSKQNYQVMGGASRLLKHFLKNNDGSLLSYTNRRWSTGGLYEAIGFRKNNIAAPNYFYFHDSTKMTLESRNKYQRHKLEKKLEIYDSRKTEYQLMLDNKYDRIWDSGNIVYVYDREKKV